VVKHTIPALLLQAAGAVQEDKAAHLKQAAGAVILEGLVALVMGQNSAVMELERPAEALTDQLRVEMGHVHPHHTAAVVVVRTAAVRQVAMLLQRVEQMVHADLPPRITVQVQSQDALVVVLAPVATVAVTLTMVVAAVAVVGTVVALVVQTGRLVEAEALHI
jgi:hypothetical protein